jgi:hypothetical protein
MTIKSTLVVFVLCLAAVGIASAKTYSMTLSEPALAGTVQLKAGAYELTLKDATVTLTSNGGSGKSITIPVKIEQSSTKFDQTSVETASNSAGVHTLHSIDLGGSNTRVVFQ